MLSNSLFRKFLSKEQGKSPLAQSSYWCINGGKIHRFTCISASIKRAKPA
jgi:hypothetical protein